MQRTAHQNRQKRRNGVYCRNASGLHGGCAPLCRCDVACMEDQFVPDPKARSGQFNASKPVFLVSREMVGKLNTIPYTTAFEPGYHFLQKIGGGIGTLLRVSPKIAKTCIFVNRCILI